ncbi:2Fe-2S iron-sulfur cluster-binding protein [Streptomyces cylindrosporus]|uniref:2Fe-2S iron-sulfur cluster-binding protein n=1 Tax=Streptomyces cylindrosporus TaxID=2927583 RepID=A0ABS9YGM6_9ACTN|nr:2Fe-2S iron-sulfur cluster-binding protein [Streptomyces cylindrosporus]MCI3276392.1 2Fe-2S iron-sulfur cluster-binding protein [Streptomyces cylindrosporus]
MTDDQHGEGTPRSGGRWDPLPQGDYDDGATAFVKLPEGGIDALLASADSPLAAPGHGYVPPQIAAAPGGDPSATGNWAVPADGAQWPDPNAVPQDNGGDRFAYNPGATQQWNFEEPPPAESAPAPGHDVTGQWSIPVAGGDLPDESGEFTTSSLVQQWGGTPPATLPGGAPAPWATDATGQPWGQQPGVGDENTGRVHESSAGTGIAPGPAQDAPTGHAREGADSGHAHGLLDPGPAHGTSAERHPGPTAPNPAAQDPTAARTRDADQTGPHTTDPTGPHPAGPEGLHPGGPTGPHPAGPEGLHSAGPAGPHATGPTAPHAAAYGQAYAGDQDATLHPTDPHPTDPHAGGRYADPAAMDASQPIPVVDGPTTSADPARPPLGTGGPSGSAAHAPVDADGTDHDAETPRGHVGGQQPSVSASDASQAAQEAGEAAGAVDSARRAAAAAQGAVQPSAEPSAAGPDDAARPARPSDGPNASNTPDSPGTSAHADSRGSGHPAPGAAQPGSDGHAGPGAEGHPDRPGRSAEPASADPSGRPDSPAAAQEEPTPQPPAEEHPLASYVLRVNGVERPVSDAWIGESLLYVLRERLGLAGAKDGCSQGECGACNVQVDGRLVASCLVPAVTAAGSEVRTVEGLAEDGQPSDVQRALARCGAVQCGFCVPGMAMTVHDLLEGNPAPTELETRQALCGNLCRCSGYRGVVDAVKEVVAEREAHSAADSAEQDGDEARIPHQAGPGAGGVNPSAFDSPAPQDQAYGPDGGQA